ncbi:MAG: nitrous oxide reductase accessory protein NosL [Aquificaceae bacterium]
MNIISRGLLALSSLLLVLVYFFPLWRIELVAPQYPEGLRMFIWVNRITGGTEYDLYNINLLNHYIGMKTITPEAIPELKIMPFLVGFLILFGLLSSLLGKRKLLYAWVITFILLGIAGLVDFYKWEYDYGHNLDPNAPIKIPGLSYQPPLIGTKQLLNMTASSFPDVGGYIAVASLLLGLLAIAADIKLSKRAVHMLFLAFLSPLFFSCKGEGPVPIKLGEDVCEYCKMVIADERFAAEVITKKGKVYKFDAIECMVGYYNENEENIRKAYVINFLNPKEFLEAEKAVYVRSPDIRSPMGMNLSAYKSREEAEDILKGKQGEVLNWTDLRELIRKEYRH